VLVAEFEAEDAEDDPFALAAVTVKVYGVPTVRPDTVIGDVPVPVTDPGDEVAVYVTDFPPVAPAVNATEIFPLNASVAVPIVGA
jgi:hypothetical protein